MGDEGIAFPGPHEEWIAERPPTDARSIATVALVRGGRAVVELAQAAPHDAEPDTPSIEPLLEIARRLSRTLTGATVYFAGVFEKLDRKALAAAVEKAGARVVAGPFPGTDFYVHGDRCAAHTIAQLERQGARRLRAGELEGL